MAVPVYGALQFYSLYSSDLMATALTNGEPFGVRFRVKNCLFVELFSGKSFIGGLWQNDERLQKLFIRLIVSN